MYILFMYLLIYICNICIIYIHTYIYIYIERERDSMCTYIYIYIRQPALSQHSESPLVSEKKADKLRSVSIISIFEISI